MNCQGQTITRHLCPGIDVQLVRMGARVTDARHLCAKAREVAQRLGYDMTPVRQPEWLRRGIVARDETGRAA